MPKKSAPKTQKTKSRRRQSAGRKGVAGPAGGETGERTITFEGVDDVDYTIIDRLRENGRTPLRDLAAATGLTETTVRSRMRKLEETDTIRITTAVNIEKLGQHYFAPVGVNVKSRRVEDVAEDLARIPEVVTLLTMIGPQDIEIQIVAQSIEDLNRIILDAIPSVPGVVNVEAALALNIVKNESQWMPFK